MELIMMRGLPGSGKSTWAKGHMETHAGKWMRVNKDQIREETGRWSYGIEDEEVIHAICVSRVEEGLQHGFDVIVDNTNLSRKDKKLWEGMAQKYGATFRIQSFLHVPVEECIRRDGERSGRAHIGPGVIRRMAERYHIQQPEPTFASYEHNDALPMWAVLCDLDGTLSLFKEKGHRGPYDASKADEDDVNKAVRSVLWAMHRAGYKVVYLSAREDIYRPQTEKFLRENVCPPGPLHMRAADDPRKDWIVKGELFEEHIRGTYNVQFILDDRNQVVEFWRSLGLTVFQVADGAF